MDLKLAYLAMKDCLWKTKLCKCAKDWPDLIHERLVFQTSVTVHSEIDGNIVGAQMWTVVEREVARCPATPRHPEGSAGFVAWEMRYKNEWLTIIILFIDTHLKYTLHYIILQGDPAEFDLQILLKHTVMIFKEPRFFRAESSELDFELPCWISSEANWKTRALAVRRSMLSDVLLFKKWQSHSHKKWVPINLVNNI